MAKAEFVKKARKDIWAQGKLVRKTHSKGKNAGLSYDDYDRSQPGEDDTILIHKGESYWKWKFRFGGYHISKEQPKRSQLTQSSWLSGAYALEEEMEEAIASDSSDLEFLKSSWLEQIEQMKDEAEEKLDNMPEGLREGSSSGQTLQEYIDAFENWYDELEGVDTDIDEDSIRQDAHDQSLNEGSEETEDEIFGELLQEKVDEILGELTAVSSGL